MPKKTETPDTTKPDDLRQAIEALPKGAKESAAWTELGAGNENITREAFRDLWLEIRVPKKSQEPRAKS